MRKLEKNYLGIIVRQHLIVLRQMVLLRERYAESRKELLQYCCNQAWMKHGGQIPWSVIAICETFKTSCLTGKDLLNGDLVNHLQDR